MTSIKRLLSKGFSQMTSIEKLLSKGFNQKASTERLLSKAFNRNPRFQLNLKIFWQILYPPTEIILPPLPGRFMA